NPTACDYTSRAPDEAVASVSRGCTRRAVGQRTECRLLGDRGGSPPRVHLSLFKATRIAIDVANEMRRRARVVKDLTSQLEGPDDGLAYSTRTGERPHRSRHHVHQRPRPRLPRLHGGIGLRRWLGVGADEARLLASAYLQAGPQRRPNV